MKLYTFPLRSVLQTDMDNYVNAFSGVMNYCNQIEELTVPTPANIPTWYREGLNRITQAKTNAGIWKSSVSGGLLQMPKSILYYKPIYQTKSSAIHDMMLTLADHPDDENSRRIALANIADLEIALSGQIDSINRNINNLKKYDLKFQQDNQALQEVCTLAAQDQKVNAENIETIKKEIVDIETLISQYNNWITVGEIAIAGGVALVAIGLAMTPTNSVVIIIGIVLAAVGAIEVIALEIAKSVAVKQLAEKQKKLIDLEKSAVSLGMLQHKVNTVLDASGQLHIHMQGMEGLWTNIGEFAGDMKRMLEEERASLDRETLLRAAHSIKSADESALHYYKMTEDLGCMKFQYEDKRIEIA